MPYIYARAQMVLVWLGTGFDFKAQCGSENEIRSKKTPKHCSAKNCSRCASCNAKIVNMKEKLIIICLCTSGYWKRLWIIQEIGKARYGGLWVHYDSTAIEWDHFIEIIKSREPLANSVPLKLDGQRKDRFHGGHTLSNLVGTNQRALCKNPRDKVYGLIGLTIDVHERFLMDYSDSPFEVFTDTIFILNRDESRMQHDILDMSRLVGRMVGGKMGLEPDKPGGGFSAGDISLNSLGTSLRVPERLVGRIMEIGPLHSDVIARAEKWNDWISLIWKNISDSQLRFTVLEQSELFLEVL
jgi:hypothetical protein